MLMGEALRSFTANLSTTVAATMTVLVGMFLFGLFVAMTSWVNSWTEEIWEDVTVRVFFHQDATADQIDAVRAELVGMPGVKSFKFVSKQDALAQMKKKYPELTRNLASNPLPPSFVVTPKDPDQVKSVAGRFESLPAGVEKVDYAEKKTERVLEVTRVIKYVSLAGSAILLFASTILIANTIRLSIFSRRREIEVMKLVGATNWFVRGPFMLEGLICGIVGSVAAILLLLVAKEVAVSAVPALSNSEDDVQAASFPVIALLLLATSLVIGAAGSGITLRRFLQI